MAELNEAITLAEGYLEGLYKPLPGQTAVQSEYYGLPIRAYLPRKGKWILLGNVGTDIQPLPEDGADERYRLQFADTIAVVVTLRWNSHSYLTVAVHPENVQEPVELWLGEKKLSSLLPGQPVPMAALQLTPSDRDSLQSLRYTVRHATQEAYLYWQAKGDADKSRRLEKFLLDNGYTPGFDMRAIIFNRARHLPDDLPYNMQAYEDCDHLPQEGVTAYPYESKACKAMKSYLGAGERDPFLQAAEALHMLQKYTSARSYSHALGENWWAQGASPAETVAHLRKQWQRTGAGIPSCTPVSCSDTASSIRTFMYGALELEFGKHDPSAIRYANAAAAMAVNAQIKSDGIVQMPNGPIYRPAHIGSFPVYWDKEFRFVAPSSPIIAGVAIMATGQSLMPPEYKGVLPSNSESTFDGWVFLTRYRCATYGVQCIL